MILHLCRLWMGYLGKSELATDKCGQERTKMNRQKSFVIGFKPKILTLILSRICPWQKNGFLCVLAA